MPALQGPPTLNLHPLRWLLLATGRLYPRSDPAKGTTRQPSAGSSDFWDEVLSARRISSPTVGSSYEC